MLSLASKRSLSALPSVSGRCLLANATNNTTRTRTAAAVLVSHGHQLFSTTGSSSQSEALELAKAHQQLDKSQQEHPVQEKGFLGKLVDRFSIRGQQHTIHMGERLFQAATRQANDPRWFGPGRIPRDFRSRHALVTMHLWFLHKRLISAANNQMDNDTCLRIQEELFEIFWNDTLCRIRKEGVREMQVNKSLLQVQQYTFLHLFHYDHIYQSLASSESPLDQPKDDDDEDDDDDVNKTTTPQPLSSMGDGNDKDEDSMDPMAVLDPTLDLSKVQNRITELKKLIWMHIFVRDPAAKECDDLLERLAWYIEAQYQNILVDWPGTYVKEARVAWVDLPDFSQLRDNNGKLLPDKLLHPDDVLPKPWLTNITLRGEIYYWNPTNGKSQWEKPSADNLEDDDDDVTVKKAA